MGGAFAALDAQRGAVRGAHAQHQVEVRVHVGREVRPGGRAGDVFPGQPGSLQVSRGARVHLVALLRREPLWPDVARQHVVHQRQVAVVRNLRRIGVDVLGIGADVIGIGVDVIGVGMEDVIGIGVDGIGNGVDVIGIGVEDVIGIGVDGIGIGVDVIGIGVDVIGIVVDVIGIGVDGIGIRVDGIGIGVDVTGIGLLGIRSLQWSRGLTRA
eukprot:5804453-Pyramimonas_sp.AAC.1